MVIVGFIIINQFVVWFLRVDYFPSFWWEIRYFMGFINYIGLMQESLFMQRLYSLCL
ncbi:hypothetical protein BPUTSESOX_796 [uncultured Gammaproteobacteria bacterium]|nr:hypothetical protein [uncultured Gammaproteobacteria bacterium]CAC9485176.1 hypothetical protein [uncultured Gammaproteobacteria bacterium]VVH50457.1 hypothetical protein BPUTSESOX_796 [uncultured Gammaproteobacteria bacterium]